MFNLSEQQNEKLCDWIKEQDKKVSESQKDSSPYYGCSGGAYTYSFTPTTLGLVTKVINNLTKEEIDLTDYNDW